MSDKNKICLIIDNNDQASHVQLAKILAKHPSTVAVHPEHLAKICETKGEATKLSDIIIESKNPPIEIKNYHSDIIEPFIENNKPKKRPRKTDFKERMKQAMKRKV
jgi:hypothetical protein